MAQMISRRNSTGYKLRSETDISSPQVKLVQSITIFWSKKYNIIPSDIGNRRTLQ